MSLHTKEAAMTDLTSHPLYNHKIDGYLWQDLYAAFTAAAPKTDWKRPINCIVADGECEILEVAIPFFSGSVPNFTYLGEGTWHVTAAGYYNSVGA
jgi:hypothetical protein